MKSSRMSLGLFVLAVTMSGCAYFRAAGARADARREGIEKFTYGKACDALWPELRKDLFTRGISVKDSDTGGSFAIETEPKNVREGVSERYLITGTAVEAGRCKIEALKQTLSGNGQIEGGRDADLEWHLIQKLDPAGAAKIESDAEAAAAAVR